MICPSSRTAASSRPGPCRSAMRARAPPRTAREEHLHGVYEDRDHREVGRVRVHGAHPAPAEHVVLDARDRLVRRVDAVEKEKVKAGDDERRERQDRERAALVQRVERRRVKAVAAWSRIATARSTRATARDQEAGRGLGLGASSEVPLLSFKLYVPGERRRGLYHAVSSIDMTIVMGQPRGARGTKRRMISYEPEEAARAFLADEADPQRARISTCASCSRTAASRTRSSWSACIARVRPTTGPARAHAAAPLDGPADAHGLLHWPSARRRRTIGSSRSRHRDAVATRRAHSELARASSVAAVAHPQAALVVPIRPSFCQRLMMRMTVSTRAPTMSAKSCRVSGTGT